MTHSIVNTPSGRKLKVSPKDYAHVAAHSWYFNSRGRPYRVSYKSGKRKNIYLHKEILSGGNVDHKNGDLCDVRRRKLRLCNQSQNIANSKLSKANKIGFKGVREMKTKPRLNKPFSAQIMKNYKYIHLGYHATAKEAAMAYDVAAMKYFGRFAKTNVAMGAI